MEIVDATRVLDVQPGLQKRLRRKEVESDQGDEHSPGKGLVSSIGVWNTQRRVILCPIKEPRAFRQRCGPN